MPQVLPLDVIKVTDIETAVIAIGNRLDLLINNVRFLFLMNAPYLITAGGSRGPGTVVRYGPRAIAHYVQNQRPRSLMLVQALAKALINCGGTVVNIGSVGVSGLPFHGVYASSKVSHDTQIF